MPVKGAIPVQVLGDLRKVLRDNPTRLTATELADLLSVPHASMFRYVNLLHRAGLLEPSNRSGEPNKGGPPARVWRWAG